VNTIGQKETTDQVYETCNLLSQLILNIGQVNVLLVWQGQEGVIESFEEFCRLMDTEIKGHIEQLLSFGEAYDGEGPSTNGSAPH
jgi:hypothetical protein